MKELVFVTTSASKYEWAKKRINALGINLIHKNMECPESRDLDVEKVALHKAEFARKRVPDFPIIVEDRGFFIDALNAFPSTHVNFMLKTIGIKGILKLMKGEENRTCHFISVLVFWRPGKEPIVFKEVETGFIILEIREGNVRGWGDLMKIYGYKTFPGKALSELSDEEWKKYQDEIEKEDYFEKFMKFLISEKKAKN